MEKRITAFFDGRFLRPEYPDQLKDGYKYELIVADEMATSAIEKQGWHLDERRRDLFGELQVGSKENMPQKGKNRSKRKREKRR